MRVKAVQAKHIDDDAFLAFVAEINSRGRMAMTYDFAEDPWWSLWPAKVIRAKAATLIRQGRMRGCACGCRGDFSI